MKQTMPPGAKATRSISPACVRTRRSRMRYPFRLSRSAAIVSPCRPRLSARRFSGSADLELLIDGRFQFQRTLINGAARHVRGFGEEIGRCAHGHEGKSLLE